eukprot:5256656-Pyramimonas_sp.AAC.1
MISILPQTQDPTCRPSKTVRYGDRMATYLFRRRMHFIAPDMTRALVRQVPNKGREASAYLKYIVDAYQVRSPWLLLFPALHFIHRLRHTLYLAATSYTHEIIKASTC